MSHGHGSTQHVTDEDLLLDYYGESSADTRAERRVHLETCDACRALDRELRGVLTLVDTAPLPEAPEGFEREMWARLEPQIAARNRQARTDEARADVARTDAARTDVGSAFRRTDVASGFSRTFRRLELPRWAFAAAAAALALGAFALGRVWDRPTVPAPDAVVDARGAGERLLRSEVEDHLERSQRVFVDLVNADESSPVVLASDRERAADLVAAGRLYRRTAERLGDAETRDLLEEVERVLVEIANGPSGGASNDLSGVRTRISDQDLIFRLRVTTAEMQERARRERPTW